MRLAKIWVRFMSKSTTFQNHVEKRIKEILEREKQFRFKKKT